MASHGDKGKPYKSTPRGRIETSTASMRAFLRRSGAGSIAIAIGALGAAALLATTLIFPPAPIQQIFRTDAGEGGIQTPAATEERGSEEPITVPTGPSEGDEVASTSVPDPSASGPQVLGTVTSAAGAGGSGGNGGSTVDGTTTTTTPSLDEDGAQPGSDPDDVDDVDDTTTTKEEDDDEIREEEDSDDDSQSKDSKSKDSSSKDDEVKKHQQDTDDTGSGYSGSKDSGSKDSKSKDSGDSDDD